MASEFAEVAAAVLSAAPHLEPLAGAALAINLAYLGLERFRYRRQIREAADSQRKVFESPEMELPEGIKSMLVYKQLCALCDLPNNDYQEAANHNKDARISGTVWGWVYGIIFSKHADRGFALASATISGTILVAGVAHNVGTWQWLDMLFAPVSGPFWMYVLAFAAVVPVVLVVLGRRIVFLMTAHARICREEIEKAMQARTQTAQLPAVVPAQNGNG